MIGGNTELDIKMIDRDKYTFDKNGKKIFESKNVKTLVGWLDLVSGDSRYDYKAKIEDSTHIFICDYTELENIDVEEARAVINKKEFDIKYIDNPMGMNEHLEIYLKLVGGQNEN